MACTSGGDAAPWFEAVDAALHDLAASVDVLVEGPGPGLAPCHLPYFSGKWTHCAPVRNVQAIPSIT